jgi:cell division protein FtsI (penicillin-binding protein 3)
MNHSHKNMHKVENVLTTQLKQIRLRLLVLIVAFMSVFMIIQIRLVDIMMLQSDRLGNGGQAYAMEGADRGKILDAHGNVVATTLITASLYGNPKMILDPLEAAKKLTTLFPELNFESVHKKLTSEKGFVWLKRGLSPSRSTTRSRTWDSRLRLPIRKTSCIPARQLVFTCVGRYRH